MATPHISAAEGDFAKTVLMPGDPLRAKFIADTFLENAKLVTSVRNTLGYTGTYKGKPVSVMASGMGMPSIGIYSYELFSFYGVENIIRIGSAGSYRDWLNVMDVTLVETAVSESSYAKVQGGCNDKAIKPSQDINDLTVCCPLQRCLLWRSVTRIMAGYSRAYRRRLRGDGELCSLPQCQHVRQEGCMPSHHQRLVYQPHRTVVRRTSELFPRDDGSRSRDCHCIVIQI